MNKQDAINTIAKAFEEESSGALSGDRFAERAMSALLKKGYVVAPKEPTEAMVEAGWAAAHDEQAAECWEDMIEAWDESVGSATDNERREITNAMVEAAARVLWSSGRLSHDLSLKPKEWAYDLAREMLLKAIKKQR